MHKFNFIKKGRTLFLIALFIVIGPISGAHSAPPKKTDVLIIGAGLSGLATAYELKKKGIPYHILEILPRVGGRVRTIQYERPGGKGFFTDSGMEEYWESNPAIKILEELKLPLRKDVALSSIVLEGKLYELGDETQDEFYNRIFTAEERKALSKFKADVEPTVKELVKNQKEGTKVKTELMKLKDISFKDWVLAKKLPSKVSDWIRVSIECEIGSHWDRLSALDGLMEFHIFLGKGELSYRVIGGNDQFTSRFADHVGRKNISLSHRVTKIKTVAKKVTISFLNVEKHINGTIEAKYVVNTIPLFRLFEVQFEPALSQSKRGAMDSMSWGAYFKAHFFLKPEAEKLWIKKEGSILPILSDSVLGVIYDGNPDQKKPPVRIISTLVHGDFAEQFNLSRLDDVRKMMVESFDKFWPGFSKYLIDVEFYRYHPRAISGWPVGRSRMDELSDEIRKPENRVYFAGDFTETTHSDGAFISAQRVAKQIIKEEKK